MFRHALRVLIGVTLPALFACDPDVVTGESMPVDLRDNVLEQGVIDCTETGDTGYTSGDAFPITVVTVDGKPVETETANAYWVMQQAAAADGVSIRIVSGFRTMSQQQYLYGCYVNCNCNNCNLAATPGYSNHQSGHALDLNTSESGVLSWLNAHGAAYGFERTVPSEDWHWEWWGGGPGGGPCDASPECLNDPSYGSCDGSLITRCDDNDRLTTGDCGAFGADCSTAGGAPHCVHFLCWTHLDGGETGSFCLDEGTLGRCDLGVYEEVACAGGEVCTEDGGATCGAPPPEPAPEPEPESESEPDTESESEAESESDTASESEAESESEDAAALGAQSDGPRAFADRAAPPAAPAPAFGCRAAGVPSSLSLLSLLLFAARARRRRG